MIKDIYAGGESSYIFARTTFYTASVDVDFACLPRGDCFGEFSLAFNLGVAWIGICLYCACHSRTRLPSFHFPFSPSTFCLHAFVGSRLRRCTLSKYDPQI